MAGTKNRSAGSGGIRCDWCGHPCPRRNYADGWNRLLNRVMCMRCKKRQEQGTLGYLNY
jgi:hypothetical protein